MSRPFDAAQGRHKQWEQRLHDMVKAHRDKPYRWGEHDCLIFSANVAKAVTGHDPARGHRRKYRSHASAYSYLRKTFAVDSPEALLDTLFTQKAVGFAQRGDIVLCHLDQVPGSSDDDPVPGQAPGLCMGAFALVAGGEGLQRVPRGDRWLKAWAVGEHHSGESAYPEGKVQPA